MIVVQFLLFQVSDGEVPIAFVGGVITEERSFVSTSGELTITFRSDSSVQHSGYEAYFVIAG